MKFKDWTIDKLINYLSRLKTSDLVDYRKILMLSGEIIVRNEDKKYAEEFDDEKTGYKKDN